MHANANACANIVSKQCLAKQSAAWQHNLPNSWLAFTFSWQKINKKKKLSRDTKIHANACASAKIFFPTGVLLIILCAKLMLYIIFSATRCLEKF